MLKKAQVHALPTEKAAQLGTHKTKWICHTQEYVQKHGVLNPHYIYFTTDEEIKEDDWFINFLTNKVCQCSAVFRAINGKDRKIVATTNPDLWYKPMNKGCWGIDFEEALFGGVAKIPTDFIEAFVREQGNIKEVMLEYTNKDNPYGENILKLRNNGTVIIHRVKEKMYNREELIQKSWVGFVVAHSVMNKETSWSYDKYTEWFNKNYPE